MQPDEYKEQKLQETSSQSGLMTSYNSRFKSEINVNAQPSDNAEIGSSTNPETQYGSQKVE